MKWILKIILLPVRLCLGIVTLILSIVLHLGKAILRLFMSLCLLAAVIFFLKSDTGMAISAAIIGFLFGPYGLPLIGEAVVAALRGVNRAIRSI